MTQMALQPVHIEQIGNQLAVRWNDGTESYLEVEQLRRSCPCAACGGEADLLGRNQRPETSYSSASFVLKSFTQIGGYALQFCWGDDHDTGIYSFEYLRKLSEAAANR
jgi:DUF971 family protein